MAKHDPMEALRRDPKAAALLGDPAALSALLQSDEAKTLASLLQQMGGAGLQQAAQQAAAGDGAALQSIVDQLAHDPQGARAMEKLGKRGG